MSEIGKVRKFEELPEGKQKILKKMMFNKKVEGAKEKIKDIGKKAVEFTPPGQIKKLVDFVKDKTKKKTGIDVNKGDQKDIKVNTGNNGSSAGSSNPKAKKLAGGGRIMLRGGGICKKGMNKNAIGRNS